MAEWILGVLIALACLSVIIFVYHYGYDHWWWG